MVHISGQAFLSDSVAARRFGSPPSLWRLFLRELDIKSVEQPRRALIVEYLYILQACLNKNGLLFLHFTSYSQIHCKQIAHR